ncbi:hypothetical protein TNCV_3581811 [Trichonephila clavipes]|nr:hypothetical protein TNCV_3581811 [Trichonephila clavipes]
MHNDFGRSGRLAQCCSSSTENDCGPLKTCIGLSIPRTRQNVLCEGGGKHNRTGWCFKTDCPLHCQGRRDRFGHLELHSEFRLESVSAVGFLIAIGFGVVSEERTPQYLGVHTVNETVRELFLEIGLSNQTVWHIMKKCLRKIAARWVPHPII